MNNLSFKRKLIFLSGFQSFVSLVVVFVSYIGLQKVITHYNEVSDKVFPNLTLTNELYLHFQSIRVNLRSLALPNLSIEQQNQFIFKANESIDLFEKANEKYALVPFVDDEQNLYQKVDSSWKNFKELGLKIIENQKLNTDESKAKNLQFFLIDCPKTADDFNVAILDLKKFHVEHGDDYTKQAKKTASDGKKLMLLLAFIGIFIGLASGFFFSQKISNSISVVAEHLAQNTRQVALAAERISNSSKNLSTATNEQASSLEETASSLEEITSMITKASDSAESAAESSSESNKKAEEGRQAVDQMLTSMDEISQSNEAILTQINESNRQMTEIVKVIEEIGNRTKVINEIVFQTKLLSFNASVEAARAGEHGKGFAVVAEEVGNLAQMSGNAAKEITDMLDASMSKVQSIVRDTQTKVQSLVENGKSKVESGVSVAKLCSDVLNEIVQNVSRVSGLSQEISVASKEQAQGVAEINRAVAQLDSITQQNASTSEETARSAEDLSAQAEFLKNSVQELISVVKGSGQQQDLTSKTPSHKPLQSHSHPLKKSLPKVTTTKKTNVVPMRQPSHKMKPVEPSLPLKTVVNSEEASSVPSRDDEGFKDV